MKLTDEFMMHFLGASKEDDEDYKYSITPYETTAEYEKDKGLLAQYNNSAAPQNKFLMIHAAKVERTSNAILNIK